MRREKEKKDCYLIKNEWIVMSRKVFVFSMIKQIFGDFILYAFKNDIVLK